MAGEILLWLFCFFAVGVLLGLLVYQLMCLSDLEFDYNNPFDTTSRINKCVLPEFAVQGGLTVTFLLSGRWFMFLLSAPLLYLHSRLWQLDSCNIYLDTLFWFSLTQRKLLYLKQQHLVDVTEVFNHLDYEKKIRLAKLCYYLVLFFIIIYRCAWNPGLI